MADDTDRAGVQDSDHRGTPKMAGAVWVILAILVWLVFGQTLSHDFVNYDDDATVYDNPHIIRGLSLRGIGWAFTHTAIGHFDPLTTISHMLDCQLFGLNPWGHHLTNVLLHTVAAILLFLVLREMTSAFWRSAFVAAVFAIHPLRVESVAWVTERKDVLSGIFFLLTIGAYVRYVRGPQSAGRYLGVVFLFALGLLSKSMLVTLPCVLLLLDYWPLRRFSGVCFPGREASPPPSVWSIGRPLVVEKLPLFALSAAACAVQVVANRGAIVATDKLPWSLRAGNAVVSYATYIGETFFPRGLAVLYPHPGQSLPLWSILLAGSLLILISAGVCACARTRPYLLVGWLWYLGMLVPVIGLIQSGELARADRYTYLPQIGLGIALTWLAADLAAAVPERRTMLGGCAAVAVGALVISARLYASSWRDSESLWTHALRCTVSTATAHGNLGQALVQKGRLDAAISHFQTALKIAPARYVIHDNLGGALREKGQMEEAIAAYRKALEINPNYKMAQNNLGVALVETERIDEAVPHLLRALGIDPEYAEAHNNLANVFLKTNRLDEAIEHYRKAIEIRPLPAAEANLGLALARKGQVDEAILHYKKALELKPDHAKAHSNLASALLQKGQAKEAAARLERALEIDPLFLPAVANLAWLLATHPDAGLRNGSRAYELAKQGVRAAGDNDVSSLRILAATYAEIGRFPEAVETAQRALELAESYPDKAIGDGLRAQIALYQAGLPFREAR